MNKIEFAKKAQDILNAKSPDELEKVLNKNGITENKVKEMFNNFKKENK